MKRTLWLLGAVAAITATACGAGGHQRSDPPSVPGGSVAGGDTTVATTVPATTTTTAPDPKVVPADITVPYVNAVLVQLNHVYGDVSRRDLAEMSLPRSSADELRSIFNDPLYQRELALATESLLGNLDNVIRPPGDRLTTVRRLISASPSCIFIQTSSNYDRVLKDPGPPIAAEYYELTPKTHDPNSLNPTPWAFQENMAYQTPPATVPSDPCAG